MKDKEHKCKILKDNLRRYKERRIKVVELELTKYELEYVHSLGYYTEVFLWDFNKEILPYKRYKFWFNKKGLLQE